MHIDETKQQELIMQLHPEGARPGSSFFLLLKDGFSLSRVSGVPLCSPLSVFGVYVVCSLHACIQGTIPATLTAVGVVRIT